VACQGEEQNAPLDCGVSFGSLAGAALHPPWARLCKGGKVCGVAFACLWRFEKDRWRKGGIRNTSMSTIRADDDRLSRCSRGRRALARGVSFGLLAGAECFPLTKITTESRGRRKRLRNASKSKSRSKSRIRIHPKDVRLLVDLHGYTNARSSPQPAIHCHAFETYGGRRRRNVSRRILNLYNGIRIA
jgi:hypothetical protein